MVWWWVILRERSNVDLLGLRECAFSLHIDCTKSYNQNAHISQVICCPQLSCHNKSDTNDIFCNPYFVKELEIFSEGPWPGSLLRIIPCTSILKYLFESFCCKLAPQEYFGWTWPHGLCAICGFWEMRASNRNRLLRSLLSHPLSGQCGSAPSKSDLCV